jgi:glycerol dehydrogenase
MIAPSRYVQRRGATHEIVDHIEFLEKTVLGIGGKTGFEATGMGKTKSFAAKNITRYAEVFNRECTFAEVERVIAVARRHRYAVILASGGKTIDAVKSVADKICAATVVYPTIASSNASCSCLSVVYDEHGDCVDFYYPKKSPDVALIDSSIIANGPARFLAPGMDDGLATWFEADAGVRTCAVSFTGGETPSTALARASLCFKILIIYDAMSAADSMGKLVKAGRPILQEHSCGAAVAVQP